MCHACTRFPPPKCFAPTALPPQVYRLGSQICEALVFLHAMNVVHRGNKRARVCVHALVFVFVRNTLLHACMACRLVCACVRLCMDVS